MHSIDVIADVRSHPFSKYSTQFDLDAIKPALEAAGLKYVYLGKELGGMPRDDKFKDAGGNADYAKLSASPQFKQAIGRILNGAQKFRIALMCGEENPEGCHRRNLIGPALLEHQICVQHIRGDGRLQTEDDFLKNESRPEELVQQLSLF